MNKEELKEELKRDIYVALAGNIEYELREYRDYSEDDNPEAVTEVIFDYDKTADWLLGEGLMIKRQAKWLWDDEEAPKCSHCGGRAMYQPHEKENGEKLCFVTLSLFCPHCGAEMENEMCEEDTEEYREREELETFP